MQNSRYLLYEAQQAHYYGLPENLALASVISNAADTMGMGHRIGYVKEGDGQHFQMLRLSSLMNNFQVGTLVSYRHHMHISLDLSWVNLDLVIWDSHPLALGATPSQVFIDGIPQLDSPYVVHKPTSFQKSPKVPVFDEEASEAVKYEGLPPLRLRKSTTETTIFTNVKSLYISSPEAIREAFLAQDETDFGVVVTRNGSMVCSGAQQTCLTSTDLDDPDVTIVDLEGGSISPGFVSFGSPLGLQNIDQEPSTNDGYVYDPLVKAVPKILGGDTAIVRAVDGLLYGSRDALCVYLLF